MVPAAERFDGDAKPRGSFMNGQVVLLFGPEFAHMRPTLPNHTQACQDALRTATLAAVIIVDLFAQPW